jgi:hypothetical protein
MSELPQPVTAAIDAIYLEFHKYPFDKDMGGLWIDNSVFQTRSLRQLSLEDFGTYLTKAITTWGTVDDFKHFLPRLLELFAQYYFKLSTLSPFNLILKLDSANWLTWPESERKSICVLFETLLQTLLEIPYAYYYRPDAFQFLCEIAGIVADVSPFLQKAEATHSEAANEQLARFLLGEKDKLLECNSITLYGAGNFRNDSPQCKQLVAWLKRKAIRDRLEKAFFNCQDPELAKVYSNAVYWHDLWTTIEKPELE